MTDVRSDWLQDVVELSNLLDQHCFNARNRLAARHLGFPEDDPDLQNTLKKNEAIADKISILINRIKQEV